MLSISAAVRTVGVDHEGAARSIKAEGCPRTNGGRTMTEYCDDETEIRCCDGCHKSFDDVPHAPMLHDHVWARLAAANENLCPGCMLERAIERKVCLDLSSLRPCAFNLFHWPRSYFNLFAGTNTPPTRIPAEWREAWFEFCPKGSRENYSRWLDEEWEKDQRRERPCH
jgi:hypothetical protein